MKQLKNKIFYIIIAIIIIIGAIICYIKGFNIELVYSSRQEIMLSHSTELDITKIEEIVKSVLKNKTVKVQKVERFGNAVEIISTEITEEEKENIINKVNEEYESDISNEDINIINIANTRIRDILKPYILPAVITFIVILVYFIIMYHKIGLNKILIKSVVTPIIAELTYYSIIAITRIPFGRVTNAIAIGIYILAIGVLTISFQQEKDKIIETEKKETDE